MESITYGFRYVFGTIVEEEYPKSGFTPVHMYYTQYQPVLKLTGKTLKAKWVFITAISTKQEKAKASFERGKRMRMTSSKRDIQFQ